MKELIEEYRLEIEAWHLFYESFEAYQDAISLVRGVCVEMKSELLKAKLANPNNSKIPAQAKRIDLLFSAMDSIDGLTARCLKQRAQLQKNKESYFELEKENEALKQEINAIKKAHDEQT